MVHWDGDEKRTPTRNVHWDDAERTQHSAISTNTTHTITLTTYIPYTRELTRLCPKEHGAIIVMKAEISTYVTLYAIGQRRGPAVHTFVSTCGSLMHARTRTHAHMHTHTHAHTHTRTHTRTHARARVRAHTHTHTHANVRMHARSLATIHAHQHAPSRMLQLGVHQRWASVPRVPLQARADPAGAAASWV
jgi:hypothetical protein